MGGLYIVAKVWTAKDETRFYGGTNMTSDSTFSLSEPASDWRGFGGRCGAVLESVEEGADADPESRRVGSGVAE